MALWWIWWFLSYFVQLSGTHSAHACKIAFGSVPNLCNYGHFSPKHCVYLVWYFRKACVDFVHIWYFNQVPCVADAFKISFGSMPNLNFMFVLISHIILKFYVCCDISETIWSILFIFGTIINHKRNLIHVKYTVALYQNEAFMSIISYILYVSDIF